MPLFQSSVLKKYLSQHNPEKIHLAYQDYCTYFHNPSIQENIRNSKEEQYQEGFLRELFVSILGYTLNPNPNFNLTTEYKNIKDSKKADGAILIEDKVRGVIELKGTNTTDLGKIEAQAFGYKNNQPDCTYVITSNFEKLRFYIDNAIEHIEFNLFSLNKTEFELLYLCLAYENLKNNIAKTIKDQSVSEEDVITKKLYKDYSLFKRELFQNLLQKNPAHDPLELFQKSQKLLDRFLFIFFAEDRNLLPMNLIFRINKEWQQLQEMRIPVSLYDRYKTYFHDLNVGAKVSLPAFSQTNSTYKEEHQIFAYNGGLFKEDELLNGLQIDDAVLFKHTENLSNYDFASEVDVNILGHIFENSLNELDEIKAQLEGAEIDKTKTKRKKDGVFYTPKYITKYIVENTVGKLCEEKKNELAIIEEEYITDKKRQKKTILTLKDKLDTYRDWLLQLTICDPACGSGAFLNQALDFLITEHQYIDELQAKLFGDALVLNDVATSILENNLFGVDLNEESVEIAKLSLWLRTAQPNRKLNDLNSNIKCGNSLIDDPEVAGEKAFHWQKSFPQVFEKGGFDVIIGNPPYGAELSNKEWLKNKYSETSFGNIDSYKYFIQLGVDITKNNGALSYIMPDSYIEKEYFKDVRIFVSNSFKNIYNIKLGDDVFEEVNLPTAIIILQEKYKTDSNFHYLDLSNISPIEKSFKLFNKNYYLTEKPNFQESFTIIKSIIKTKDTFPLIDVYSQVMGVKVYQIGKGKPKQTNYEIENNSFVSNISTEEFNYKYISQGIKRYDYETQNEYIKYGECLAEPRSVEYFDNPKIVIREIINPTIFATYIEEKAVVKNIAAIIIQKDNRFPLKYLLGIINSKLINYYVNEQSPKSNNKSYPSFNSKLLKNIPIKDSENEFKLKLIELVEKMLLFHKNIKKQSSKFQRSIQRKFNLVELPKKLQNWYYLTYAEFIQELGKTKIKLGLSEEAEWEDFFEQERKKAQELKAQIDATDKAIDQMVYELYGLSEEEIGIVEGS
jgi:type I restriction-modification system DNA methylase subunit